MAKLKFEVTSPIDITSLVEKLLTNLVENAIKNGWDNDKPTDALAMKTAKEIAVLFADKMESAEWEFDSRMDLEIEGNAGSYENGKLVIELKAITSGIRNKAQPFIFFTFVLGEDGGASYHFPEVQSVPKTMKYFNFKNIDEVDETLSALFMWILMPKENYKTLKSI